MLKIKTCPEYYRGMTIQNSKSIRILAIETSCDETSASVVEGIENPEIKTNIIASQIDIHKITGGVVPEVAARAHCESIIPVIEQALGGPIHTKIKNIDAIAVTVGPGLVGSLLVGVETAKALAFAADKPLIPVNHLEGHIFAAFYESVRKFQKTNNKLQINSNNQIQKSKQELINEMGFDKLKNLNLNIVSDLGFSISNLLPALALVVSGGHTELVLIKDMFEYEIIGQTLDDAAGEAFDKVATLLNLPYPGGPEISKLAENIKKANLKEVNNYELLINNYKFKLPRPMLHSKDLNFSFSGLKTAVVNLVKQFEGSCDGISSGVAKTLPRWRRSGNIAQGEKAAIAHEFQEAVVEVLLEKTQQAIIKIQDTITNQIPNSNNQTIKSILLTGGVSANKRLREAFQKRFGDKLLVSPLELCGDNAGMIGLAAWWRAKFEILNSKSETNPKSKIQNPNQVIENKNPSTLNSELLTTFPWKSIDVDPNLEL